MALLRTFVFPQCRGKLGLGDGAWHRTGLGDREHVFDRLRSRQLLFRFRPRGDKDVEREGPSRGSDSSPDEGDFSLAV